MNATSSGAHSLYPKTSQFGCDRFIFDRLIVLDRLIFICRALIYFSSSAGCRMAQVLLYFLRSKGRSCNNRGGFRESHVCLVRERRRGRVFAEQTSIRRCKRNPWHVSLAFPRLARRLESNCPRHFFLSLQAESSLRVVCHI